MKVVVDDLTGAEVADFLEGHIAEMRAVTPPQSKHALDLEGLRRPEVTFWSAYDGPTLVGTAALLRLGDGHGEIKSMRVAPTHRRLGVASMLLRHVETEARRQGITRLSLETGSFPFFEPARRLYLRHGYAPCGPFADYVEDPNAAFMTKELP